MPSGSDQRLKIAYLTLEDPKDKRTFSCGMYYMAQALQKHCGDVSYIGPIQYLEPTLLRKIIAKSSLSLLKKRYLHEYSMSLAEYCGRVATERLARQSVDVIVTLASEVVIAFLETSIPIVLLADSTNAQLLHYMPYYSNLVKRSEREIKIIEELAFNKISHFVFSSAWAAHSAVEDCHVDKNRIHIVPFGGNLDAVPPRQMILAKKKSECCRLLFMGVDWKRKGGDIAFETLLKLEAMGIVSELIVCGCTPPKRFSHKRMTIIPFLDKNDERQCQRIKQLYLMSDFLLLPTRADCTPFVFSEASAFGLPVITTNTGGISEIIRDNENGFMLPFGARGNEYAEVIARIYQDDQRYTDLVMSSRDAFEDRLNWDAWGMAIKEILQKKVYQRRVPVSVAMQFEK